MVWDENAIFINSICRQFIYDRAILFNVKVVYANVARLELDVRGWPVEHGDMLFIFLRSKPLPWQNPTIDPARPDCVW